MDMVFLDDGRLVLTGRARDLHTNGSGDPVELAAASVRAVVGQNRMLEELETSPFVDVGPLLGIPVAAGFRAVVDRSVPAHRDLRSPLYLLLDDLPVTALISGYATLYRRGPEMALDAPGDAVRRMRPQSDICSGWRSDGVMMRAIGAGGGIPTPVGPVAPVLESPDDPWGWHPIPLLPTGAMRRRRLVDVARSGDSFEVAAMFRDTHVDPGGTETVLHEYELHMVVEAATMTVQRCVAAPRTLPWPECPAAAASAVRLEGHQVADVRSLVRTDFRGTSTCTHLNDLLRSLADVEVLVASLT